MPVSPITTHILDTARGCPAAGVAVKIEILKNGNFQTLAEGKTNSDGRVTDLLAPEMKLEEAVYRMRFETAAYFSACKCEGFYPYVEVVFELKAPKEHYHIPLLLSPFGYSTYRGS